MAFWLDRFRREDEEDIWEELTGQKAFKAKVNEMMNAYNEEMDKLEKEEIALL